MPRQSTLKHGISTIYKALNDNWPYFQIPTLSKWTEELNANTTPDMWKRAFRLTYIASYCSNHWESYQKILHWWFLTRYHLSKIYLGHSVTCWRSCGSIGTIVHMLWYCRFISSYWRQIFSLISSISHTPSTYNPSLALLHLGIEKCHPNSRVVLTHLLLAAKLNITRFWKTSEPPNISYTITDLNLQCEMDRIVAGKNLCMAKFLSKWSSWLTHPKCTATSWSIHPFSSWIDNPTHSCGCSI